MMPVVWKDLRELLASPALILAAILWSCAVLSIAAALPLANPELKIAILGGDDCEAGDELFDCSFPGPSTLAHAIADFPAAAVIATDSGPVDIFDLMDREGIDVALAWHRTDLRLDDVLDELEFLDFGDVEADGIWMAYTSPRSRGDTMQIRLVLREVQISALNIENARRRDEAPLVPTLGVADLISEAAPLFVARQQAAREESQDLLEEAIAFRLDERIRRFEERFGAPLTPELSREMIWITGSLIHQHATRPEELIADRLFVAYGDREAWGAAALTAEQAAYLAEAFTPLDGGDAKDLSLVMPPFVIVERDGPARTSSAWLIPGLILIIATATAFMFTASSVTRERENGTEHLLVAANPRLWPMLMLTKAITPSLLALMIAMAMMLYAQSMLGFGIKPKVVPALGILSLAAAIASVQGFIAGALLRSQASALAASGAYLIMLLLLGGIFIPVDRAAPLISWIAGALPIIALYDPWTDWFTWGAPITGGDFVPPIFLLLVSLIAAAATVEIRYRAT